MAKSTTAVKPAEDLQLTGYASDVRLLSTRYKQGQRTVFGLDLSPEQLVNLIPVPDPTVSSPGNRRIRVQHAQDFGRYFRERQNWVIPAIILRAPNIFNFEPTYEVDGSDIGVVSFTRAEAQDIHILDGQHRILGFAYAAQQIAKDLGDAQSELVKARRAGDTEGAAVALIQAKIDELKLQRKRLETERVSVDIFVEEDMKAYRQMFFDIADNALGITASVRARFDTTKVTNRATELVLDHPLLLNRVDGETDRIGRGSPYLMGAKHVGDLVRTVVVGISGRISRVQEKTLKESFMAKETSQFLDTLVEGFSPLKAIVLGQLLPDDLRKTSLLGSVNMLRGLAGVYHELVVNHAWKQKMVEDFFKKLNKHMAGPVYPGSIWLEHMPEQVFSNGGMAPHARHQDMKHLAATITEWAIDNADFVNAEPAERPEPEPVTEPELDIAEMSEEAADEILRPETAKARRSRKAVELKEAV